jgi:hypothetical protein
MGTFFQLGGIAAAVLFSACTPAQRSFGTGGGSSTGSGHGGGASTTSSATTGTGGSTTSSAGSGGTDGGVDFTQTCADYGAAVCAGYQKCAPDVVQRDYGDMKTCADRFALFCTDVLEAPQTSWTPAKMTACATALGPLDCFSFLTAPFTGGPKDCQPDPGQMPNGNSCVDSGQCASAYCKRVGVSICGTCGPRSNTGESCITTPDCDPHLACVTGACVAASPIGGACSTATPCDVGLLCRGTTCQNFYALGASCDADPQGCDPLPDIYCNTAAYTCQDPSFAQAGQPCGKMGGAFTDCLGAGFCGQATPQVCVGAAADGAACNVQTGPHCMRPAVCRNGVCALGTAGACP